MREQPFLDGALGVVDGAAYLTRLADAMAAAEGLQLLAALVEWLEEEDVPRLHKREAGGGDARVQQEDGAVGLRAPLLRRRLDRRRLVALADGDMRHGMHAEDEVEVLHRRAVLREDDRLLAAERLQVDEQRLELRTEQRRVRTRSHRARCRARRQLRRHLHVREERGAH